jgi:hypothetical protein
MCAKGFEPKRRIGGVVIKTWLMRPKSRHADQCEELQYSGNQSLNLSLKTPGFFSQPFTMYLNRSMGLHFLLPGTAFSDKESDRKRQST